MIGHNLRRVMTVLAVLALGATLGTNALGAGATFTWTGASSDDWTDSGNWTLLGGTDFGSNGYPDGDGSTDPDDSTGADDDRALFGDAAPNLAQSINLDVGVGDVGKISVEATGNRSYTIDTDASKTLRYTDELTVESGSTQGLTVDTDLQNMNNFSFRLQNFTGSSGPQLVVNGDLLNDPTNQDRFSPSGDGTIRLNGSYMSSGYSLNQPDSGWTGDLIMGSAVPVGNTRWVGGSSATPHTFSAATDVVMTGFYLEPLANATINLRIADSGSADRMFSISRTEDDGSRVGGLIQFVDNEAGSTGNLTLRLNANADSNVPIDMGTQSGATVEFYSTGGGDTHTLDVGANSATISGAGRVLKTGPGTLAVETTNTYAGGTVISGGTVALNGGYLPTAGVVRITSGTLDLNGQDQETEGLAGAGTVDTDGGTFKVTETLDPGDVSAVGALTINGGTLEIGDGVTYAYHMDPVTGGEYISANDIDFSGVTTMTLNLAFAGGDVGVLQSDELVLFEYTGTADISGVTFQFLSAPGTLVNNLAFLNNSNITDTGTQIILSGVQAIGVPEPSTLAMLLVGALLLRRRFRRKI